MFCRFSGAFNTSEAEDAQMTDAALLSQASGMCSAPQLQNHLLSSCHSPQWPLHVPPLLQPKTLLSLKIPAAGIHSTVLTRKSKALGGSSLQSR